jgi:hypothetical protein
MSNIFAYKKINPYSLIYGEHLLHLGPTLCQEYVWGVGDRGSQGPSHK